MTFKHMRIPMTLPEINSSEPRSTTFLEKLLTRFQWQKYLIFRSSVFVHVPINLIYILAALAAGSFIAAVVSWVLFLWISSL